MDGLDEFEKTLAEEKQARERSEKHAIKERERKHRHQHRRHHKARDHEDDRDRDGHRRKRSRHSRDAEDDDSRRTQKHVKTCDPHEDLPIPDDETPQAETLKITRDSWMTEPSALDIDYTQKGAKKIVALPPAKPDYDLKIHKNELNHHLQDLVDGKKLDDIENDDHDVEYTFGDSGAQWRMTKLKAVYTQAEQSGRAVDEVAVERFGSLREFDTAREEQIELDRRQLYGQGYVGKEKPSGDLFQERKVDLGNRRSSLSSKETPEELPQGKIMEEEPAPTRTVLVDSTTLNRMKAQLMKAKLKNSPDVPKLEAQYNEAIASFSNSSEPGVVVLGKMDNRMLAGTRGEVKAIDNKRGRERGLVEENEDMSIEDMVREERRTRGQAGGEGMRAAERIAKDAKFDDDLDYMDDNANKLAKRVQKSEINLKNAAIGEFQKMNRILDNCQLCTHEDKNQPPIAPMISLGTRVYLTLPTEPELSEGGAVIVPIQHRTNLLECDDDEWEEIRNFMKCLTRMYHDQGRDVVFYENAAAPHRKMHAAMQVVPLPYSLGETAPAFFKEAILSSDEEWTQHKKLIDTAARARDGLGKLAFRRTIAKEMPYFHAWFELDGGLGHIVEDSNRWPKGDLFAREIIGGMLDLEPDVIKRQGRWNRGDKRLEPFKKRWRKFDWTRALTDG